MKKKEPQPKVEIDNQKNIRSPNYIRTPKKI
jgi:hypothetical protein